MRIPSTESRIELQERCEGDLGSQRCLPPGWNVMPWERSFACRRICESIVSPGASSPRLGTGTCVLFSTSGRIARKQEAELALEPSVVAGRSWTRSGTVSSLPRGLNTPSAGKPRRHGARTGMFAQVITLSRQTLVTPCAVSASSIARAAAPSPNNVLLPTRIFITGSFWKHTGARLPTIRAAH